MDTDARRVGNATNDGSARVAPAGRGRDGPARGCDGRCRPHPVRARWVPLSSTVMLGVATLELEIPVVRRTPHRSSLVSTEKTVGPMLTTRRGARCRELELSELPKTQTDSRTKSKRMASGPPIFADDDPRPRKFLDLHPDGRVKVTPPSRVCRRPAGDVLLPLVRYARRSFEGAVYVDASHQAR